MLTASVENMLVTSIDTTLETGVGATQYIAIISTVRRQSDSHSRKLVSNVRSTLIRLLISAWVNFLLNLNSKTNLVTLGKCVINIICNITKLV